MSHPILAERTALCDRFLELGPDASTRCGEWTTLDLAAHLWIRERRPDTGPGLVLGGPFGRHTESVRTKATNRSYPSLVSDLRGGPPPWWPGRWAPTMDVHEWFVHHEDVRRPAGDGPRELGALDPLVWDATARWGKMLLRKSPVGVDAATPDGRRRSLHPGDDAVTLEGEPGEILLRIFGRTAEVTVTGSDAAVAAFVDTPLGL